MSIFALPTSMPTKRGSEVVSSMGSRPCICGLDARPRRLFGVRDVSTDGAPRWTTGSIAPGGDGVPSAPDTARLSPTGILGEIQGGSASWSRSGADAPALAWFRRFALDGHPRPFDSNVSGYYQHLPARERGQCRRLTTL